MPKADVLSFKEIISHLTSTEMDKMTIEPAKEVVSKNELIAKVISTVLGLAASFTCTYFGVKWLVNAMDPTRKEKQEAQIRVGLLKVLFITH